MNAAELLKFRRDLVTMIAVLQPELQVEIGRMEEVQRRTEAAAKIIGTQAEAETLRREAEEIRAEAIRVARAQVMEAEKTNAEAQEKFALLEASLKAYAEAEVLQRERKESHLALIREHAAQHNTLLADHAKVRSALDLRADKLSALEERLRVKETEMAAQMRKVREAVS